MLLSWREEERVTMNHTWTTISQWESDDLTLLGNGRVSKWAQLSDNSTLELEPTFWLNTSYMHCTHQSQHTIFSRLLGGLCLRRAAREWRVWTGKRTGRLWLRTCASACAQPFHGVQLCSVQGERGWRQVQWASTGNDRESKQPKGCSSYGAAEVSCSETTLYFPQTCQWVRPKKQMQQRNNPVNGDSTYGRGSTTNLMDRWRTVVSIGGAILQCVTPRSVPTKFLKTWPPSKCVGSTLPFRCYLKKFNFQNLSLTTVHTLFLDTPSLSNYLNKPILSHVCYTTDAIIISTTQPLLLRNEIATADR